MTATDWRVRGVVAVLLVIVLSSCGGGADSATTTTAPGGGSSSTSVAGATSTTEATTTTGGVEAAGVDPCSLLATEDIVEITGIEFGDAVYNDDLSGPYQSICDWTATGDEFATAQVLVVSSDVFDTQRDSAAGVFDLVDVDIPGVDEAYATSDGSLVGMRIDGQFVQVAFLTTNAESVMPQTTQLAAVVASNFGA
jgi:Protein of unknown function (DUF3558)